MDSKGLLVTGSQKGVIRKLDFETGELKCFSVNRLSTQIRRVNHWAIGRFSPMNKPYQTIAFDFNKMTFGKESASLGKEGCRHGALGIDGCYYIAFASTVSCFSEPSWKCVWEHNHKEEFNCYDTAMRLASDGQHVYLQRKTSIICYDAKNGEVRWRTPETDRMDSYLKNELSVSPKFLYVRTRLGTLMVLDKFSGKLVWKSKKISDIQDPVNLSLMNGKIFVPGFDRIHCFKGV